MSSNTRLSDIVLENATLSMSAKGIFVSIGFLGNGCRLEQLQTLTTDSDAALTQALNELVTAGYVKLHDDTTVHIKLPASFGTNNP